MPNLNLYAETGDKEELSRLLQLVLGCAVNCDKKSEYIKIIMDMHEDAQHMIMTAIQDVRID
jgi:protein HOOK1